MKSVTVLPTWLVFVAVPFMAWGVFTAIMAVVYLTGPHG